MSVDLIKTSTSVSLPESLLKVGFNETLVHQVLTSTMTNARAGTKRQKNRSDVRGGGRKPRAQKGSGGARIGTIRSPLHRGGGRTFAARPKTYNQKINKKMYQSAMRSIIAQLCREDRVLFIEDIQMDAPSTKAFVLALQQAELSKVLFVVDSINEHVYLSMRNIPNVMMGTVDMMNPVDLIAHEKIVLTTSAAKKIGERFA